MKKVKFCNHAYLKFKILKEHGVHLLEGKVEEAVKNPDRVVRGYGRRKIAEKFLDATHTLRVIYEESGGNVEIITFYPARRERYENEL